MNWVIWFIEHSIEIASLLVTIILFWVGSYLIKINNKQNISLINSPNSKVIQTGTGVTPFILDKFIKNKKDKIVFSEEIEQQEKKSNILLDKIENYLDENKSVPLIAEMALRLAKELKLKMDEEWLEKEVHGFKDSFSDEVIEKGLKMRKSDKEFEHRRVEAELNIMAKGGKIEKLDVPMFFSQPLRQIEDWAERYSQEQKIIMNAPPMELMVETLKVDPKKNVPYLVNPSSFKRILNEVRSKIIEFLNRAKEEID